MEFLLNYHASVKIDLYYYELTCIWVESVLKYLYIDLFGIAISAPPGRPDIALL